MCHGKEGNFNVMSVKMCVTFTSAILFWGFVASLEISFTL